MHRFTAIARYLSIKILKASVRWRNQQNMKSCTLLLIKPVACVPKGTMRFDFFRENARGSGNKGSADIDMRAYTTFNFETFASATRKWTVRVLKFRVSCIKSSSE